MGWEASDHRTMARKLMITWIWVLASFFLLGNDNGSRQMISRGHGNCGTQD